jgi:hypothetical protein
LECGIYAASPFKAIATLKRAKARAPSENQDTLKHCYPLRGVINQRHKLVDARSLGLPICDCKESQVCQLTGAPIDEINSTYFRMSIVAPVPANEINNQTNQRPVDNRKEINI